MVEQLVSCCRNKVLDSVYSLGSFCRESVLSVHVWVPSRDSGFLKKTRLLDSVVGLFQVSKYEYQHLSFGTCQFQVPIPSS